MPVIVEMFPCREDNFGYLIHDEKSGETVAIDAPNAQAIRQALKRRNWKLSQIFVTHHDFDHTDDIPELKSEFNLKITGPRAEADKIDTLDVLVGDGDTVVLGATTFHIYETPGHTIGHIVYHDPTNKIIFTADALFSLGCGRMKEGTPGPMWDGLAKLRALPDDTLIYCGHEYTAANAKFALSIDPDNKALQERAAEVKQQRAQNKPTLPVTLGAEKAQNPFLRADHPTIAAALNLSGNTPADVFAALRKAKDVFKS